MASLDSSALHTFFEKSRSGMAILGRDMHFLNVNPALCLILGYAEDELEGKDWAVVSDSVDWDVWERLKSGDLHEASFNQRFINRSHAVVELHLAITAIPDGEAMPSRFAVLAEDVTHDLEDDSSFHYLFDNMLNGLAYCRMLFENGEPLDFIYLRVNSAFEMQTGLKHVVGHKVSEVIPGIRETDPGLLQAYGRVAMTGQPERFEVFLDALQMWFHVSVYSPKPEHFVAVFDVITDRKNTENHLRLISEAFAHADEGILIVDRQGNIVEANPACSRITGYSREELLGKNPRIFQSGRQDDAFYAAMWGEILSQGHWTGEIWNRRKNGEVYPEKLVISVIKDGADEPVNYIGLFSDISTLKEQQRQLELLAYHDPLTGLPNRALFDDRLSLSMAQARRSGGKMALCFMDLDGFKPVNDSFGHRVGDMLLVEVANRLTATLRATDTVARLGGDEFVMILSEIQDEQECENMLLRIMDSIREPYTLEGTRIEISSSVGVTLYPDDGVNADALLRHADQAMYLAKDSGRNCCHFFDGTGN